MNPPVVCVVVPVFNAAKYLAEALASVLAQTYPHWHMVVLDDGSSDGSLEIARRFASVDQRVTVQHDGHNRGLVWRLNQMVTLTNAPLIARMDGDDIMHSQRLALQVEAFRANPNLDILGTAAYALDHLSRPYGFKKALAIPETAAGFLSGSPIIHPSVMFRREWLETHRYDADYERAEDYALWWTTHAQSTIINLPQPLLFYRERGLPYRGKYRRTAQAQRRLLRLVGQRPEWQALTRRVIATTYVKTLLYDLASALHLEHHLIERRSRPLTPGELLEAYSNLNIVKAQAKSVMEPG